MFLQNQMLKIGKMRKFPFVSVEFCISTILLSSIILGWGEQSIMVGLKMVTKQRRGWSDKREIEN